MDKGSNKTVTVYDAGGRAYELAPELFQIRNEVYGLIKLEERVLVVKDKGAEKWRLPGGAMAGGEPMGEAMARFVKEQTGVETEALGVAEVLEDYAVQGGENLHKLMLVMKAEMKGGEVGLKGVVESQVKFEEIDELKAGTIEDKFKNLV